MARIDLDTNCQHLRVLEKAQIDCCDVIDLLDDYVEHELPPALKTRFDEHVEHCPACQEVKYGYQLVIELARELGTVPMPVAVENRLRQGLNKRLGISLSMIDPVVAAADC